jgi:hypothetical protein
VVDANVVTEQNLQSDVDTATSNITEAQKNLNRLAVLTVYNDALAAVVEADYTTASWAIYQSVLDANVVTEQDPQSEVDTATSNIIEAQNYLVHIADLYEYNLAINAVVQVNYTTASWAIYQAVLDSNQVTDQDSQEVVDTATANIIAAQKNLVQEVDSIKYSGYTRYQPDDSSFNTITFQLLDKSGKPYNGTVPGAVTLKEEGSGLDGASGVTVTSAVWSPNIDADGYATIRYDVTVESGYNSTAIFKIVTSDGTKSMTIYLNLRCDYSSYYKKEYTYLQTVSHN